MKNYRTASETSRRCAFFADGETIRTTRKRKDTRREKKGRGRCSLSSSPLLDILIFFLEQKKTRDWGRKNRQQNAACPLSFLPDL